MLIVGEENITESLEDLVVRGYCFHGSSVLIDGQLKPSLANDDSKETGNRKAVYLSKNPLVAEFRALCGGIEVGKRVSACFMKIEDGKVSYDKKPSFGVEKPSEISEIGYIYVVDLRTSGLEEIGGEILSYQPIEPLFAIKMKKEEFKYPIETIS